VSGAPAPFPVVVGVPRSGTTLLRLMIDAHPGVAIPPETGFLMDPAIMAGLSGPSEIARHMTGHRLWCDFGIAAEAFVRAAARLPDGAGPAPVLRLFYRLYGERFGKPRGGDKTPMHLLHLRRIAAVLPEARFVHIIRDGRDVALSWRKTWFAPSRDVVKLVGLWRDWVAAARREGAGLPYLEVRYEDLIGDPAGQLARICHFLDLAFEPAMLDYHRRSADRLAEHNALVDGDGRVVISREDRLHQQRMTMVAPDPSRTAVWQREMTADEVAGCWHGAADLLLEMGYRR
jgi:hypothetical protein